MMKRKRLNSMEKLALYLLNDAVARDKPASRALLDKLARLPVVMAHLEAEAEKEKAKC